MSHLSNAVLSRVSRIITETDSGYLVRKSVSSPDRDYEKLFSFSDYNSKDSALSDAQHYANDLLEHLKETKWLDVHQDRIDVVKTMGGIDYGKSFQAEDFSSYDEAMSAAKEYRDSLIDKFKYITEIPTGFMVRKTIKGKVHQEFFGLVLNGGHESALEEAIAYRDKMSKASSGYRPLKTSTTNKMTGYTGVLWHCHENKSRPGSVVHNIRAQAPNLDYAPGERTSDGKIPSPLYKAFSVNSYGLWFSYLDAVEWRMINTSTPLPPLEDLLRKFSLFMNNYMLALRDRRIEKNEHSDPAIRQSASLVYSSMVSALENLCQDDSTPYEVIQMVPRSVRDRHDTTANRFRILEKTTNQHSQATHLTKAI